MPSSAAGSCIVDPFIKLDLNAALAQVVCAQSYQKISALVGSYH